MNKYKIGETLKNGYQVVALTFYHVLAVGESQYATWALDSEGNTYSGNYGHSYKSGLQDLVERASS